MEEKKIESTALDRALKRRFSLLEKTRIHRIAERCFQSDEPPVRERRFIVKGLGDTERPINIAKKADVAKVTYHPIDPEVIRNYNTWLAERKTLREDLNQLGNYTSWIQGKRNPTALESRVLQTQTAKLNALCSDYSDSIPSTPELQDSSLADSDRAISRSTVATPPPVSDAIRILQEYVDKRHLRLHDLFTQDTETPGELFEAPRSPSEDSNRSSFSPLEWAQYSHRLVPSLESNLRDRILNFRDEAWNEYQNLVVKCSEEKVTLSVITLAKGLLAPGDRRWEECTRHLRQMTGLEMVQHKAPDIGKGVQDNPFSSESCDKLESKVSKFYDTTLQYRDIAKKNPGEKMRLSTGVAIVRPRTDCWMSYEEYLALTANVRTKFRWVYGTHEPWCGHLLDKIRLCMPMELSRNGAVSLFNITGPDNYKDLAGIKRGSGYSTNPGGYHQSGTKVRQNLL
ncbi:uncharacterized protein LOC134819188 isoform X3 [Bolinopsis microptera]|uniref:uncharacterized protein LOC134819188 isoform X3 n=1 Tax=Bolinopsis microptera TaxID=2820187 RepID=UPI0030799A23